MAGTYKHPSMEKRSVNTPLCQMGVSVGSSKSSASGAVRHNSGFSDSDAAGTEHPICILWISLTLPAWFVSGPSPLGSVRCKNGSWGGYHFGCDRSPLKIDMYGPQHWPWVQTLCAAGTPSQWLLDPPRHRKQRVTSTDRLTWFRTGN